MEQIVIKHTSNLPMHIDEQVCLIGNISNMPDQHLMAFPKDYPEAVYFDMKGGQIVLYTKENIPSCGNIQVNGTIIEVTGETKHPGSTTAYREFHLLVHRWETILSGKE